MPDLMTVEQVAAKLNRSEYFVRNELKRKNLRGTKIGRHWGVKPSDLEAYVEARMNLSRIRRQAS